MGGVTLFPGRGSSLKATRSAYVYYSMLCAPCPKPNVARSCARWRTKSVAALATPYEARHTSARLACHSPPWRSITVTFPLHYHSPLWRSKPTVARLRTTHYTGHRSLTLTQAVRTMLPTCYRTATSTTAYNYCLHVYAHMHMRRHAYCLGGTSRAER